MFGFHLFSKAKEALRARQKAGIEFIAALLISYPEFYAASYDAKGLALEINFLLQGEIDEEKLKGFPAFLQESIETYHLLEDGIEPEVSIASVDVGDRGERGTVLSYITRDIDSLTRGELTMIADILIDTFGDSLVIDKADSLLEDSFLDMESNVLDKMLGEMPKLHLRQSLIGLREGDRVIVYNN